MSMSIKANIIDLNKLKKFILKEYSNKLNFKDEFYLAISLGYILVENTSIKAPEIKFISSPLDVIEILKNKYGCICGQYQLCFFYILKSFNIKSRTFGIYTIGPPHNDTDINIIKERYKKYHPHTPTEYINKNLKIKHGHALIEFFTNDRWYIFDPTYNCLYQYNNEYLDSENFIKHINNNKIINFKWFYENENNKKIITYPIPIEAYKTIEYI
jgi:hypothetical protein